MKQFKGLECSSNSLTNSKAFDSGDKLHISSMLSLTSKSSTVYVIGYWIMSEW